MFHPSSPFDPAGDIMRHYNENAADAQFVSVKHYDIKDLVPLMGHLASLTQMKTLILSDNLLTRLPEDMSSLSALETLDISRNPIQNAAAIVRGLYSLPNLRNLYVTLPEEDEDQLVATLGHLKTLNGVNLDVEAHLQASAESHPATAQSFLQTLRHGTTVDIPRGYSNTSRFVDPKAQLNYRPWSNEHLDPLIRVQDAVRNVSGNLTSQSEYSDLVDLVEGHVRARTRNEPDTLKASAAQFLGRSLLVEYSFDELVRSAAKYGPQVADALHEVFHAHVGLIAEASRLVTALQVDRDCKIDALQEDLAKELLEKERGNQQSAVGTAVGVDTHDALEAADFSDAAMSAPPRPLSGVSRVPLDGIMPIDELRAVIKVFFDSKKKHDAANASARLPAETVEQHIYTFLFGRTSTDDEIKQTVASLFNSIRHHAKNELDIEVFSLILRYDCDEDYWDVFTALRANVFDVIQSVLADGNAQDSWSGFVSEDQAREIVSKMIPQETVQHENLLRAVTRALVRNEESGNQFHISYTSLGTTMLRFYVAAYLASIRQVSTQFKQLDPEKCGVIDTQRTRVLLNALFPGIASARAQEILSLADPHSTGVMTFSSVVRVFGAMTANAYGSRSAGTGRNSASRPPASHHPSGESVQSERKSDR